VTRSYRRIAGQRVERLAALSDGIFTVAMALLDSQSGDENQWQQTTDAEWTVSGNLHGFRFPKHTFANREWAQGSAY
jgi:hypothetical protein